MGRIYTDAAKGSRIIRLPIVLALLQGNFQSLGKITQGWLQGNSCGASRLIEFNPDVPYLTVILSISPLLLNRPFFDYNIKIMDGAK